ncbi:DNA replication terminus site-binding protein [Novosphingobium percolationis]|uniref:DNA replication terminus site-binding protein n=1 Tax=Novosphingobium percolationis TaxID=2871811 RepID=UPI001CD4F641|nr:DNA replication terminus site-binding protein [Novosphingobium percolationis]
MRGDPHDYSGAIDRLRGVLLASELEEQGCLGRVAGENRHRIADQSTADCRFENRHHVNHLVRRIEVTMTHSVLGRGWEMSRKIKKISRKECGARIEKS